jgi:mannose-1-phosphate guanylyltransferase
MYNKEERPWGSFEILTEDIGYKVKRIIVEPNKRLSLQKHTHRSEHWVIVSGNAFVTINDNKLSLTTGDFCYIKKEDIHRLENIGSESLILIETQLGDYLGEDDIIRLSDDWNRT